MQAIDRGAACTSKSSFGFGGWKLGSYFGFEGLRFRHSGDLWQERKKEREDYRENRPEKDLLTASPPDLEDRTIHTNNLGSGKSGGRSTGQLGQASGLSSEFCRAMRTVVLGSKLEIPLSSIMCSSRLAVEHRSGY